MPRIAFLHSALVLVAVALPAQQAASPPTPKADAYANLPADAAKQQNPVKATPESLTRGKKWWTMDCAMCHSANGDGKGETASDMKLTMADLSDPATLKNRTDGEIFYVIKDGIPDMPPEGPRVKTGENWDLVNYVRSLARKSEATKKPNP